MDIGLCISCMFVGVCAMVWYDNKGNCYIVVCMFAGVCINCVLLYLCCGIIKKGYWCVYVCRCLCAVVR